MSKTFNRQSRIWPSSTPTTWENGDGVHTREAFDLVTMLNNLLLCEPGAGMTPGSASSSTPGYVKRQPWTSSREVYICQKPIRIPPQATSFRWLMGFGVKAYGATEQTTTTTNQTVYLSTTPYTGYAAPVAFDTSLLAKGYTSQDTDATLTVVSTDDSDYMVTGGNGGALSPFRPEGVDDHDPIVYMVVTMTGSCTSAIEGTDNGFLVWDEAHWFGWS